MVVGPGAPAGLRSGADAGAVDVVSRSFILTPSRLVRET